VLEIVLAQDPTPHHNQPIARGRFGFHGNGSAGEADAKDRRKAENGQENATRKTDASAQAAPERLSPP